jgi:hypothetical protein
VIEDQIIDQRLHGKDLDVAHDGSLEGVDGRQETVGIASWRAPWVAIALRSGYTPPVGVIEAIDQCPTATPTTRPAPILV